MHALLTPIGSAGDVYPFLEIGRALEARGHEVTVFASATFEAAAARAGVRLVPTWSAEEFDAFTKSPDLWDATRGPRRVVEAVRDLLERGYRQLAPYVEPGRTLLVGHTLALATRILEDAEHLPAVTIHLAPSVFRSAYQQPVLPPYRALPRMPAPVARLLWRAVDRFVIDPAIAPAVNRLRAEVGLPPVTRLFKSWVHSPNSVLGLFPGWFAEPPSDWPPQLHLAGFVLSTDESGDPGDALRAFLDAGPPPIAITPGSANRHARPFFSAAVAAARRLGRRAVLVTPYDEQVPAPLPHGMLHVVAAPFSTLFPRCAAIIHHGGIGTSAQGLAAGIPQIVSPFSFDQPDNASHLVRLGVGRVVIPSRFTAEIVASALSELFSSGRTAAACRQYADAVRASDALGVATRVIETAGAGLKP
ncbi:MAG TPA: glycosyltransferase [Vicinamibacterales bacterium]